jgi:hypothetical protein
MTSHEHKEISGYCLKIPQPVLPWYTSTLTCYCHRIMANQVWCTSMRKFFAGHCSKGWGSEEPQLIHKPANPPLDNRELPILTLNNYNVNYNLMDSFSHTLNKSHFPRKLSITRTLSTNPRSLYEMESKCYSPSKTNLTQSFLYH